MRGVAVAVVLAVVVGGCGGEESEKQAERAPTTETTAELNKTIPLGSIANVGDTEITRGEYENWLTILKKQDGSADKPESALREQTMEFVISAEWLRQEADERDITVSEREIRTSFEQQKKQSFPTEAEYRKFLRTSGMTERDVLYRASLDLITNKIQKDVQSGAEDKKKALDEYVRDFHRRYRAITWCAEDYRMDKCANGPPPKATPGSMPAPR